MISSTAARSSGGSSTSSSASKSSNQATSEGHDHEPAPRTHEPASRGVTVPWSGRTHRDTWAAGVFPLMILSGMLLPLDGGPGWMRALARANPLTYVVDAERALFAGDLLAAPVLWGFVAAGLTAAAGLAVGIRSMRRSG